jgi:uncharacterized protein involved in exopolysaccharide biosynthesis
MSRYFDLAQEVERDEAFRARRLTADVLRIPAQSAEREKNAPLAELNMAPAVVAPQPRPSSGNAQLLSLRSLVEACFRQPLRLAIIAASVLLITVLAILLLPKSYEATMQIVVLNTRQYSVISSEAEEPIRTTNEITDNDVNSQAELLRSRDILNQALDQMGAPSSPALARDKALQKLERKLDVAPVRNSNILNVSYVDSSPQKATQTLQAIASSFVGKELALLRPTHQQLFASLVERSQRDLGSAQQEFAAFKVATGIASVGANEAALLRQVEGSSVQSATLAAELAEERRRAQTTDDQLARNPERIITQNRSTPNQQAVEALTSKLVDLQNKRTSLLTGYEPTERIVQEVEQQISTVQKELAQLRNVNAVETTSDINPLNMELKTQLAKAQIATSAIAAQRRSVDAQKQSYLEQLNRLEQQSAEFDRLQKRVAEAQRNLDLAVQKRDQAAVDDALDKDRVLNVAFAAKPSASAIPVQPRPVLYLGLGLFAAVFLGVGSCALGELGRKTISSPAELDNLTGLTTLGSIPLQRLEDGSQDSWLSRLPRLAYSTQGSRDA